MQNHKYICPNHPIKFIRVCICGFERVFCGCVFFTRMAIFFTVQIETVVVILFILS